MQIKSQTEQGRKALVILSGGMDSVTLLYEYRDRVALGLSFDYGSKHNASEIPMARMHCERLEIPHIVIPLGFIGAHFSSSLLASGGAIPTGHYDSDNVKSTVVPFRNGIMLSVAAGLAESHQLDEIYIANHFGDHALYPDCRSAFISPMARAVEEGTTNRVRLCAPYTDLTKGEIALRGKEMGLNYAETWSCYQGGDVQCGVCATCLERKEAMAFAGMTDPTSYLS